ncbi:MAG: alpha/beta hydrolase [Candidatus Aenigmarchaeota archaeon]|nr:alpha/beta hydrolase [Candidatus Aenigmarchaeota archaeon]
MAEVKISIKNDSGETLSGLKAIPTAKKDKYPAIVLVHGFGVTKEEYGLFDIISKKLASSGFLVYRFDFSGCGGSEGDFINTTITKQKDELSKIIDSVRSDPDVDADNVGIIAQSFGTSVTVALNPDVKAIVFTGSISHPKNIISNIFEISGNGYNPLGISEMKRSDGSVTRIDSRFWDDLDNYDLPSLIGKSKCPFLFLNGSEDDKVPVSETDDYFSNVSGIKERIIVNGGNHNLYPKREDAAKLIADWFKKIIVF